VSRRQAQVHADLTQKTQHVSHSLLEVTTTNGQVLRQDLRSTYYLF